MGVSHSLEDMEEIRPTLHLYDIEYQSRYADHVVIRLGKDSTFVDNQIRGIGTTTSFSTWNTTAIGNCAYLSLYAPKARQREFFRSLLTVESNKIKKNCA